MVTDITVSLETNPFYQIGMNQAYQKNSQILLFIKQTNAPNVMSTPFLIFTTTMQQKGMIMPSHVVFCFLDESSFYKASDNFKCLLRETLPNKNKVLFKGLEMTLYIV